MWSYKRRDRESPDTLTTGEWFDKTVRHVEGKDARGASVTSHPGFVKGDIKLLSLVNLRY
jgi:hypothetical protein